MTENGGGGGVGASGLGGIAEEAEGQVAHRLGEAAREGF